MRKYNKYGQTTALERKTSEYRCLVNMKNRCYNENSPDYSYYGGRGITVCDRWLYGAGDLSGLACFVLDMGRRPSAKHSIDRYPDGDGNYEPDNCRWATRKQQTEGEVWRRKNKAHQERLHSDPDWRRAISEANKGNKYCLGYKHSPETRAKMSASRLGKPRGPYQPETKPRKRRPHSPETRAKIAAANKARGLLRKGVSLSPETRAKMSASRMGKKRGSYKEKWKREQELS